MNLRNSGFLSILFVLLFLGCSGGGTDPVTPLNSSNDGPGTLANLPLIDFSETGGVAQATGLLGAFELTINPENLTADFVSKRAVSIGDSYTVRGDAFFTITPCKDCLTLIGINPGVAAGTIMLEFELNHPFAAGDPGAPPTAMNRNDLDVFDVAMVVYPTGGTAQAFAQTGASAYSSECVGASGYTTELANMLTDTAAMPYFLCVDDSTDATPPVSTWNKFAMGGTTTFEVGFNLTGPLVFDTYLTMGYGHSAQKLQRLTPKYYNPEFNRKAAWKVDVIPPSGTTPGTTWDTDDIFPQTVEVRVYDWQIGAPVSAEPDFGDALETEIFAASDPTTVTVEVLGMSAALPSASAPDVPAATGGPDDPWVYTIAVPHDATPSLADGTYPGLVAVSDSRVPVGAPPAATNDYLIDSPDGIDLVFYNIDSFITYQSFEALVVIACGPIDNMSIDSPACPITGVSTGGTVDFEVSATSLNGGLPIALYEIDTDYDGVTFTADDSNTDGLFTGAGPFDNPNCPTPTPVDYTVAFRVTDSCVPPNTEIFPTTCTVTVDTCASYQEIEWDFAGCGLSYTCGNWQAGGCGLPNTDGAGWGSFNWGCTASGSHSCGMVTPYLTTGGDGLGCGWLTDNYPNADYNVVSPTITMPTAADTELELDYCLSTSGGTFFIYVSENACTGPWNQVLSDAAPGCKANQTMDISAYSGTDVKFRFRFQQSSGYGSGGSCSNAGVVMDNVKVSGTFGGTLAEN